jgi:hypothetical protein
MWQLPAVVGKYRYDQAPSDHASLCRLPVQVGNLSP